MKIKYLVLPLFLALVVCDADIDSFDNEGEVFEDEIEGNVVAIIMSVWIFNT